MPLPLIEGADRYSCVALDLNRSHRENLSEENNSRNCFWGYERLALVTPPGYTESAVTLKKIWRDPALSNAIGGIIAFARRRLR